MRRSIRWVNVVFLLFGLALRTAGCQTARSAGGARQHQLAAEDCGTQLILIPWATTISAFWGTETCTPRLNITLLNYVWLQKAWSTHLRWHPRWKRLHNVHQTQRVFHGRNRQGTVRGICECLPSAGTPLCIHSVDLKEVNFENGTEYLSHMQRFPFRLTFDLR